MAAGYLSSCLPVGQVLEQRHHAEPQVERNHSLNRGKECCVKALLTIHSISLVEFDLFYNVKKSFAPYFFLMKLNEKCCRMFLWKFT